MTGQAKLGAAAGGGCDIVRVNRVGSVGRIGFAGKFTVPQWRLRERFRCMRGMTENANLTFSGGFNGAGTGG
mgnify:CR=1 FL=1